MFLTKVFKELKESEDTYIRIFFKDVDEYELKWHWDEEDRTVEVIGQTNWEFQFDNELPIKIDKPIFIPKGSMHRIIKGDEDLMLKITKHKS
jgi:hypothetical protein